VSRSPRMAFARLVPPEPPTMARPSRSRRDLRLEWRANGFALHLRSRIGHAWQRAQWRSSTEHLVNKLFTSLLSGRKGK
jgi:hypothetical protein